MGSESKTFPSLVSGSESLPVGRESSRAEAQGQQVPLWTQIAMGYGLILAAIWTPDGLLKIAWMIVASVCILLFNAIGPYTWREMGVSALPAAGTFRILVSGLALAGAIPAGAALTGLDVQPIHPVPWHSAWQYVVWAVVQQFILQSFLFVRMESLVGKRAVWLTAALFALAHIPNPVLTVLTFFGGIFFCEMFRRYRSILPLGIVHGGLGLMIAASFSDTILHHMRVGLGYLVFHP